jgi:hypothetical protein
LKDGEIKNKKPFQTNGLSRFSIYCIMHIDDVAITIVTMATALQQQQQQQQRRDY